MKTIELHVEKRSSRGKNEARRTRMEGKIPAIVYGAGKATVPITVDRKALSDAVREGAGENAIFLLKLGGSDQTRHAMIRELQKDPLTRKALHIDFVRVMMDAKIRVKVSIEVVGVARGVKTDGGILDTVTREVEIECLPTNIPAHLPIDVSELGIGDALRIRDLHAVQRGHESAESAADSRSAERGVLRAGRPQHGVFYSGRANQRRIVAKRASQSQSEVIFAAGFRPRNVEEARQPPF